MVSTDENCSVCPQGNGNSIKWSKYFLFWSKIIEKTSVMETNKLLFASCTRKIEGSWQRNTAIVAV